MISVINLHYINAAIHQEKLLILKEVLANMMWEIYWRTKGSAHKKWIPQYGDHRIYDDKGLATRNLKILRENHPDEEFILVTLREPSQRRKP